MTGKTHIMGGIASTVVATHVTNYDPVMCITAGAIGGLIPDICHGGSKIGRKFPLLSKVVNALFGHRTFTHSLLFLLLTKVLLSMFISNQSIIMGVLIGMCSHFILDAVTKRGIQLFYPIKLTVRLPITAKTGGTIEYMVLLGLIFISLYYGKDFIFGI
ncbi:metal-dependent hydrolase [Gracilibacillus sp. YIM 98692]|uniref:metal-dependent hydrolase n=1 Tax=Gracilibacillus sp. YIM 98692 TaxID=2663532 RepID=UPI0013CFEB91|nr:metal-dependent hydrolase [Gracilibacillus sp. YIM 98692]